MFQGIRPHPHSMLMFEIHTLNVKKSAVQTNPIGWGIVPLFRMVGMPYVHIGAMKVPVYQGAVQYAFLTQLRQSKPKDFCAAVLAEASKSRKAAVKLLGRTCAFVRVMDPRLREFVSIANRGDFGKYSNDLLPEGSHDAYSFDLAAVLDVDKPLASTLPRKRQPDEFELTANTLLADQLSLPRPNSSS